MEIIKLSFVFAAIIASSFPIITTSEPFEDKEALLDFIRNVQLTYSPNWDESLPLCFFWTGVTCNSENSRVIALHLPGMGIRGSIPSNTLSRLSAVQILSLRSNGISGAFPSDFTKLKNLTALYLEYNNFTGPLPKDFSVWSNLTVLDLSGNGFNGSIPNSISNLQHLTALNLSNNHLTGTVPRSLLRYPSSAFSGNDLEIVTVTALPPAIPVQPPHPQPFTIKSGGKLSEPAILGIVLGICVVGFVTIALTMIWCFSKKSRKKKDGLPVKLQKKEEYSLKMKALEKGNNNRLEFFEGCSLAFDLEDLLRASAEVLGKGTYGTTYKAALEDLNTVVVKRLKEVTVTRKDFEQQMVVVGSSRHENVSPLRAYYYSKDEKLMVYDFYDNGSVSTMLHGRRGEDRTPLDWETRVRIAVGAARGIAYIHTQQTGKLVHGNIRSSNIFLNSDGYGCISDVGLATLMSPLPAPVSRRAAGYSAPEIKDPRKSTPASDVYSFGVLLLELLTGKSPTHATTGSSEEAVHLVRWVNSVVREEWTGEVFDVELLRYPNIEEEMVEMLQIGMNCVVRTPDKRPKMAEVVKMVEGIRRLSVGSQTFSPDAGVEMGMSTTTTPEGTSSAVQ